MNHAMMLSQFLFYFSSYPQSLGNRKISFSKAFNSRVSNRQIASAHFQKGWRTAGSFKLTLHYYGKVEGLNLHERQ